MDGDEKGVVRISDSGSSIEIRFLPPVDADHPVHVAIATTSGLQAAWNTSFEFLDSFVKDLETAYKTLSGSPMLSDNEAFSLSFDVNKTGQVHVTAHVECMWALGVDGTLNFMFTLDQSYLPALIRDFRRAPASGKQGAQQ